MHIPVESLVDLEDEVNEADKNGGRFEVTEEMVGSPLSADEIAAEIAIDHFTKVVVTPLDEVGHPILDDRVDFDPYELIIAG